MEWDDLNKTFSMVLGTCYSSLNLDLKHTNPTTNAHTPEESLHTGNTFKNRGANYRWPTPVCHPPGSQGPCVISSPFQAQWNAYVTRNTTTNHLTRGAEQRPQFSSFSLSASPSSHPTNVGFQLLAPLAWAGRTSCSNQWMRENDLSLSNQSTCLDKTLPEEPARGPAGSCGQRATWGQDGAGPLLTCAGRGAEGETRALNPPALPTSQGSQARGACRTAGWEVPKDPEWGPWGERFGEPKHAVSQINQESRRTSSA